MKKSDKERLKKIVATWESLKAEMHKRGITPELLLEDEFSQWAVTTHRRTGLPAQSGVQGLLSGAALEYGRRAAPPAGA